FDACPNGRLAPLAYSDPIPNTPFAVRRDLPDSFKRAVRDALLQIKDKPELVAQLRSWYVDAPPQLNLRSLDQYYNPLRDVARLLNLDLRELAERG
ncbi:MAG: PhnD/SsuA/transferrin family substrate-binding protein, partial [Dehalococcoidia bacterium]|nr:PhnD/SsuA/transferrin family substrate-binding protein [Dehalococcoidia bacterium]